MNKFVVGALALGAATFALLPGRAKAQPRPKKKEPYVKEVYPPGSSKQIKLFEKAAGIAGVPVSWASDPDFLSVLKKESAGVVGIPNYQYGKRKKDVQQWPVIWDELRAGKTFEGISSATGLGQMIVSNVDALYPHGRDGIGVALDEAVGMLRYIKKRYGSPGAAWDFWQAHHWY